MTLNLDLIHAPIPDHVPQDLVRMYPFVLGNLTGVNPFHKMVHEVHKTMPPIFYVTDAYPGGGPAWVVRKSADLKAIYADDEHFSVKGFAPFAALVGQTWDNVPAGADAPMHDVYRTLLNPLFTPLALKSLEASVTGRALALADSFRDCEEVEFRRAFAVPFPVSIVLDLMGLPQSRMDEFMQWEHSLLHDANIPNLQQATRNVVDLFRDEANRRRANPGEDLVSFALKARLTDPLTKKERPLTEDEIVGFCFNLFVGGLDTVTTNLCWQVRHLAENPNQQEQLRNNPGLIGDAIQEMLRAYAAVSTFRTCIKAVEIAGVTLMPGDRVMMSTTLANNDPEQFSQPEAVRFERKASHMAFGSGIHHCLGHHLARRELTVALSTLLSRLRPWRLNPGPEILTDLGGVIQPRTLPLVFAT